MLNQYTQAIIGSGTVRLLGTLSSPDKRRSRQAVAFWMNFFAFPTPEMKRYLNTPKHGAYWNFVATTFLPAMNSLCMIVSSFRPLSRRRRKEGPPGRWLIAASAFRQEGSL